MNTHEQRLSELATHFWKSGGCPVGQDHRQWEMAGKQRETHNVDDLPEKVTGHVPSIILPEEPFNPDPAPEIDPAPPQPGQPNHVPRPDIPQDPKVPVEPISPAEYPPQISPTLPSQPKHPYASLPTSVIDQ